MPRNFLPLVLVVAVLGIGAYVAKVILLPRIQARQTGGSPAAAPVEKSSTAPLEIGGSTDGNLILEEQIARAPLPKSDGRRVPHPQPAPSPPPRLEPSGPIASADAGSGEDGGVISWPVQEQLMRKYLEALEHLKD